MPESVRPAMRKGNRQERKERTEDSFELVAGARAHSAPAPAGLRLEVKFKPKLHHAGAARSNDRIAVDDVRSAAAAAERTGNRGIVADVRANHAAVWIGEIGAIEHVKQFDPEFGSEPLLKLEVLEHGEVQILEARVVEKVPSHSAIGSKHRGSHHRVALHVAAARGQRAGSGGGGGTL